MNLAYLNIFYDKFLRGRPGNHVIQEMKKKLSIFHLLALFIIDLFHNGPKAIIEKKKKGKKFWKKI